MGTGKIKLNKLYFLPSKNQLSREGAVNYSTVSIEMGRDWGPARRRKRSRKASRRRRISQEETENIVRPTRQGREKQI